MSNTASRADTGPSIIALTAGEPSGIGPDLLLAAASRRFDAALVAYSDPDVMAARASLLGLSVNLVPVDSPRAAARHVPGRLFVVPVRTRAPVVPGRLNPENSDFVLACIRAGVESCRAGISAALVTGPVHKAAINDAGIPFRGHTEFLAELCGGGHTVMMLASSELRVALVTTHIPLAEVSRQLSAELLEQSLLVIHRDLQTRFCIADPRLLVCGLNPHAGEQGYLGTEEQRVLIPVLESLRGRGLRLAGPVPADTAFTRESLAGADVVVTMYHDQGLPALKALGFGRVVNITLGLPIIRTSVDHGTALELAGSGRAAPDSLYAAIELAVRLADNRRQIPGPGMTT